MNDVNLSGWWDEDGIHHYPLRVYYADTDAAGVVYHSTYLDFAERARAEMVRLIDLDPNWRLGNQGALFVVRACEIDYRRPAKLDDRLVLRSHMRVVGGASFTIGQEVWRDQVLLVALTVTVVCVRDNGQPTRVPEGLRKTMTELVALARRKE